MQKQSLTMLKKLEKPLAGRKTKKPTLTIK